MSDILKRFLNKEKQNNSLFKAKPGGFGSPEYKANFDKKMQKISEDVQRFKNRNRFSESFNKQVTANVKNIAGKTFFDSGEKSNPYFRSRYRTSRDEKNMKRLINPDGSSTPAGEKRYGFDTTERFRNINPDGSFGDLKYDQIREDLVQNRMLDPRSGKVMTYVAPPASGYKGLEEQAKLSADMSFGLSDALRRYSSTDPRQAQLLSNTPEGVRNALAQGKQTLRNIRNVKVRGNAITQPFVQELSKDQLELYKEADKKARQYAATMRGFDNIQENIRAGNFSTSPESPSTFQQLSKNIKDFKFATPLFKKKIKKYKK